MAAVSKAPAGKPAGGGGLPRWAWYAAAGLVALVVLVYLRRTHLSTSAGTGGASVPAALPGLPGTGLDGGGGAASVPGNLPPFLVSQPDTLTRQVQTANAASVESPSTVATAAPAAPQYGAATPQYVSAAGVPAPGTFAASTDSYLVPTVTNTYGVLSTSGTVQPAQPGYGRAVERPGAQMVYVDATGHVTSPLGTRVGGRTLE